MRALGIISQSRPNFFRLHDWQIGWFRAFEDAAGVDASLPKRLLNIGSVAHEASGLDTFTRLTGHGDRMACR